MTQSYRVLARKYRPATFSDMVGQDVLVRTLTNAITSGRIAHAFLLTGIRGVGKTTTARIIARALNCIGADEKGGPTPEPCGVCSHCRMIAEDRHVDIVEMDAASHTGVGDMRELIDTVHYLPSSARYKVYIIDEVHMLSTSAFNALLKTLEEPPPHVKFVFATTEIRKIPVTILSRCQRFDLKRVDRETLSAHLRSICAKESIEAEGEALKLVATAAEGSVRDALSLLDQAIAHSLNADGATPVTALLVRDMLGLADRAQSFDLLEPLLKGDMNAALTRLNRLHEAGADPLMLMQDMLELTHFITRMKMVPALADDLTYSQMERERAAAMAAALSIPVLSRCWQMLLKGVQEVRLAPQPLNAAEMLLIRIAHAAQLPLPSELVKHMQQQAAAPSSAIAHGSAPQGGNAGTGGPVNARGNLAMAPALSSAPTAQLQADARPHLTLVELELAEVRNFEEAVALFAKRKEALIFGHLKEHARLVSFTQGRIEVNLDAGVPADMVSKASRLLSQWTGERWVIAASDAIGGASLSEQQQAEYAQRIEQAKAHPLVKDILEQFPGAEITGIK